MRSFSGSQNVEKPIMHDDGIRPERINREKGELK